MSGYANEKSEDYVYSHGYAATRSSQDPSYAGFTQPSYDTQYPTTQPNESHALSATHEMPFLGEPFQPRDAAYQPPAGPLINARSRSPEITSTGPFSGKSGQQFHLEFRSKSDYSLQVVSFVFMFGFASSKASLTKNFYRDPYYHFTLTTEIPSLASTRYPQGTMPLLLDVLDENEQRLSMKTLDNFSYLETVGYSRYTPTFGHKRKHTEDSSEYAQPPAKRSTSQPLQANKMFPPNQLSYGFASNDPLRFALPTNYERPVQHQRSYVQPIAQKPSYQYPSSPNMRGQMKTRSPSVTSYISYSNPAQPSPSPHLSSASHVPGTQGDRMSSAPPSTPALIRTSILQPSATAAISHSTPGFNPYSLYPTAKAKLEIKGDLFTMCDDWTDEELRAKRRLVEFRRSQEGSIISTSFKPVALEERTPNSPCISCIWWEEKRECYVTSVDTIQLLESLVAVRFTVEEKNRIRRNLEGFKPMTVSKQKEDCESFFRLIMGFPNPKPRNIEKDVKVFAWADLSNALTKIIGKYSASYSSTSSLMNTTSGSGYGSSVSETTGERRPTASPQSTASSIASHAYQPGISSTAMSPNMVSSTALGPTSGAYEPQRSSSQMMTSMGHWQASYAPVSGVSQYTTGLSGSGRSSWDMNPYMEHGISGPAAPITTQHLQYYRDDSVTGHVQSSDTKTYSSHSQATSHG